MMQLFSEIPKADFMRVLIAFGSSILTFSLPDPILNGAQNINVLLGVITSVIGIVAGIWAIKSAKHRVKRDKLAIEKKRKEIEQLDKEKYIDRED